MPAAAHTREAPNRAHAVRPARGVRRAALPGGRAALLRGDDAVVVPHVVVCVCFPRPQLRLSRRALRPVAAIPKARIAVVGVAAVRIESAVVARVVRVPVRAVVAPAGLRVHVILRRIYFGKRVLRYDLAAVCATCAVCLLLARHQHLDIAQLQFLAKRIAHYPTDAAQICKRRLCSYVNVGNTYCRIPDRAAYDPPDACP